METITKPSTSKQQVRDYMQKRCAERTPPPDPAEIRRQLGMCLNTGFDRLSRDFPR